MRCKHIRFIIKPMWVYVKDECPNKEKEKDSVNGDWKIWYEDCKNCTMKEYNK